VLAKVSSESTASTCPEEPSESKLSSSDSPSTDEKDVSPKCFGHENNSSHNLRDQVYGAMLI